MAADRIITAIVLLNAFSASLCFAQEAPSYPRRIISLGPALTEQLYLLGAQEELVAVTTYCQEPLAARKKEKIGTILEVNLEKVLQLEPDLVLTTSLTNPKTKEKLNALGINTADFPQPNNFSQICEQFLELGRLLGKEKAAWEIIRQAKMKVDIIREGLNGLAPQKVFVQVGARPLFTVAEDSFFNDLIEFAGGINVTRGLKSGLYSREKVLLDDPDVIIITTMGIAGEEEKKIWENFPTLKAAKNKRIHIVDAYRFCSPTPPDFAEALKEMAELLHPQRPQGLR